MWSIEYNHYIIILFMHNQAASRQILKFSKAKMRMDSKERNTQIEEGKNNRKYMPNLQIERHAKIRVPPPVKNLDVTEKQKQGSKRTYNKRQQIQSKPYATPCKTNKSDKTVTNDYHTVSISQRVKPLKNQEGITVISEYNLHKEEKNVGIRQNNHQGHQNHAKKDTLINPQSEKERIQKATEYRNKKVIKQASPPSLQQLEDLTIKQKLQDNKL